MPITAQVLATGKNPGQFDTDVARLIGLGNEPRGNPFMVGDLICQAMAAGSSSATFEDLDARVTAAEADIDATQAQLTVTSYTADGAVSITDGTKRIAKTSLAAMTLAAPAGDDDVIEIFTDTAFAHQITATGLIWDGTGASAKNTITAAAFPGCGIRLRGYSGKWYVIAKNGMTIA
jgi:hypothetical protein